jgi:hypothetical protein
MTEHDAAHIERPVVNSPWLQASRLAFLGLYVVTLLAAVGWAVSNVREIDPQNRAGLAATVRAGGAAAFR